MSFHDVRFPAALSLGSSGGPERRTEIVTLSNGFEERNSPWAHSRRRYDAGRFSFNVAGGRCPTCEGEGSVMVELLFLPSVYAPCPDCHGTRYKESTLEVLWRERSVADVLGMSVDEAHAFFEGEDSIHHSLGVLRDVGLGYLRLGQPVTVRLQP